MLTHIVRHIFRTARPTNFKLGTRMEDNDPHQPQVPWPLRSKVKVARSRDQSEPSWPNAVPAIPGHTVLAKPGGHTFCLIWGDLRRITCVHCVHTAAWKSAFKSVFVGLHALSKLSYAIHATQRLQYNQKTEIRNACTWKTQCMQSILSLYASALNKWTCYRGRNASVSERRSGGLTCRSPGSTLDNQQRGPTTTVARLTPRLLFSFHERRTSQGHLYDQRKQYIRWRRYLRYSVTASSKVKMESILSLFDSEPVEVRPRSRPPSGTTYVYVWDEDKRKCIHYHGLKVT